MAKHIIKVYDWKEKDNINKFINKMEKTGKKVWNLDMGNDSYYLFAGKKKPTQQDLNNYDFEMAQVSQLSIIRGYEV